MSENLKRLVTLGGVFRAVLQETLCISLWDT